MSELKAYCPYANRDGFYHKSEADKVIAELKEEASTAHRVCSRQIQQIASNEQELRHSKYKRCLTMASYWVAVSYQCVDDKHRQSAERHHRKWLELAEKFKEEK